MDIDQKPPTLSSADSEGFTPGQNVLSDRRDELNRKRSELDQLENEKSALRDLIMKQEDALEEEQAKLATAWKEFNDDSVSQRKNLVEESLKDPLLEADAKLAQMKKGKPFKFLSHRRVSPSAMHSNDFLQQMKAKIDQLSASKQLVDAGALEGYYKHLLSSRLGFLDSDIGRALAGTFLVQRQHDSKNQLLHQGMTVVSASSSAEVSQEHLWSGSFYVYFIVNDHNEDDRDSLSICVLDVRSLEARAQAEPIVRVLHFVSDPEGGENAHETWVKNLVDHLSSWDLKVEKRTEYHDVTTLQTNAPKGHVVSLASHCVCALHGMVIGRLNVAAAEPPWQQLEARGIEKVLSQLDAVVQRLRGPASLPGQCHKTSIVSGVHSLKSALGNILDATDAWSPDESMEKVIEEVQNLQGKVKEVRGAIKETVTRNLSDFEESLVKASPIDQCRALRKFRAKEFQDLGISGRLEKKLTGEGHLNDVVAQQFETCSAAIANLDRIVHIFRTVVFMHARKKTLGDVLDASRQALGLCESLSEELLQCIKISSVSTIALIE